VIVKWSPEELNSIGSAAELHIAIRRPDGRLGRWTPIWVVCVDEQVYVRTWYRRETGWYGHALLSRRARIPRQVRPPRLRIHGDSRCCGHDSPARPGSLSPPAIEARVWQHFAGSPLAFITWLDKTFRVPDAP
jgi:hypothetical protein